jgi:hypothetical protein
MIRPLLALLLVAATACGPRPAHVAPRAAATRARLVPTSVAPARPTTSAVSRGTQRALLSPGATTRRRPGVIAGPAAPIPASRAAAWACIRRYESGGDYRANTGNGYFGAYQFALGSWRSVGGSGLPSDASPAEQDRRAEVLLARQGWGAWPVSSRKCGLR